MPDDDILISIHLARFHLELAWRRWYPLAPPESVKMQARIALGQDWLLGHPEPGDQKKGIALLASLREQLDALLLQEALPGAAQAGRLAWDDAAARFVAADAKYLELVGAAWDRGVYGKGEKWTALDETRARAQMREIGSEAGAVPRVGYYD
jgi:hypothetical protein